MSDTLGWAVPVVTLGIAALIYAAGRYSVHRFDKKYGRDL